MNEKQLEQFITMQNDITNIKDDVAEIKETLKCFIEKSEEKFAGKWVERVLWSGGSVIGVAVLAALLQQILK